MNPIQSAVLRIEELEEALRPFAQITCGAEALIDKPSEYRNRHLKHCPYCRAREALGLGKAEG
jgi:hypothetical protein